MTLADIRGLAVPVILACALPIALHAQGAGTTSIARTVAMRTTTSAARTASALMTLSKTPGAATNGTSVLGYLWAADGSAIENATVRLRNVVTGQILQEKSTYENGIFAFSEVPQGSYAIEYVSDVAGKVTAVGHAFSVAPGETVGVFLRLGPTLAGFVPELASSAARAVIENVGQAVASGVVSVAGSVAPEQPASPLQ